MNDPLFAILSAVGQLAWSAAVRAARTPTGQQVVARAAGLAAAGATQATVNKLRDKDIDVSPGVEGLQPQPLRWQARWLGRG